MNKKSIVLAICLSAAVSAFAQFTPDKRPVGAPEAVVPKSAIEVKLVQKKVVFGDKGAEQLADADSARPDDVIEYQATRAPVSGAVVTRTLQALAEALNDHHVGPVKLSVGHGDRRLQATPTTADDAAEARSTLWLARVGAMRRVLQAKGPRRIGIVVDSQDLASASDADREDAAATAASSDAVKTVRLAVIAAPSPMPARTVLPRPAEPSDLTFQTRADALEAAP